VRPIQERTHRSACVWLAGWRLWLLEAWGKREMTNGKDMVEF
jgi:hypothetical protein